MTTLREAAQQALEAMEYSGMDVGKFNRINAACAALKAALSEPVQEPAQQDNETIAQTFSGLPKRKLRELLAAGWQINGVCFQRTEEDGTVRRGAATTGGMVLWWNQEQPAQQQEPVGEVEQIDIDDDGQASAWFRLNDNVKLGDRLYTAPPQRKPLSDADLAKIWDDALDQLDQRDQLRFIARAIERAHGIGSSDVGT